MFYTKIFIYNAAKLASGLIPVVLSDPKSATGITPLFQLIFDTIYI